jgi:DNA-binding MarR family transcriptional regulator
MPGTHTAGNFPCPASVLVFPTCLCLSIDSYVYEIDRASADEFPSLVSTAAGRYNDSVTEIISDPDTAAQLMAAVSGLRRALRRRLNRGEAVANLSDSQRELVRTVRRHPGIRVGEAASELHLAANTVSTLVSSLVRAGWIHRETDLVDARSVRLYLTPEAERSVEEWRDRRLALLNDALSSLSNPEQERIAAAVPALQQLVQRVGEAE